MASPARSVDTAFAYYLRTGRRTMPLELKHNDNHDELGRFTFAEGGGGRGSSADPRVTAARSPAPVAPRRVVAASEGPFRSAAPRQDRIGAMARQANAFVHRRIDRMIVPIGGIVGDLKITRGAGDMVEIDNRYFSAHGRLSVTPGLEELIVTLASPVGKLGTKFTSFPSHLRLFQAKTGRINYSIDRDISGSSILGEFPNTRRGTYLGPEK